MQEMQIWSLIQGAKHVLWPKIKTENRRNIVTNSVKTFKKSSTTSFQCPLNSLGCCGNKEVETLLFTEYIIFPFPSEFQGKFSGISFLHLWRLSSKCWAQSHSPSATIAHLPIPGVQGKEPLAPHCLRDRNENIFLKLKTHSCLGGLGMTHDRCCCVLLWRVCECILDGLSLLKVKFPFFLIWEL